MPIKGIKMNDFDQEWCMEIVKELIRMPISFPFRRPVDPNLDGAPDYYDLVSIPIDLETMKKKIQNRDYSTVKQFVRDVKQIRKNSVLYNGANNIYDFFARDMIAYVKKKYLEKADSEDEQWYKQLIKANRQMQDLLTNPPILELTQHLGYELPSYDLREISHERIKEIEQFLGNTDANNIPDIWQDMNVRSQKKLAKLLEG